ncbi:cell surface protein SprA [Cesiribacter andamanensis AMV16]|uniref:Cell surface protein SprA n=2 Tax=Cesiribacter TaxID=1133570 RepID=M7N6W5_9BACT|nr:cell surface protein SprA [Cesiribacter andamanensis AMV16]
MCCLLALPLFAHAQTAPAPVCRWIRPAAQPLLLDSLTVLPQSIRLADSTIQWTYQPTTGLLHFNKPSLPDSLLICYQTLAYSLHQPVYRRTLAEYDSLAPFKKKPKTDEFGWKEEELFASDDIEKSGSISRGISFGNTQDLFVQSALNLQLEGQLTDKIGLRASISDQNVPFQPDGNTQNLQEFDKVFVELYTDSSRLTAGDLQLRTAMGSFLRYQRNVQGLSFGTTASWLGRGKSETSLGIAAARGQFTAVELEPVEGMLGPYRLSGPNGQGYVMVLANSERVFLDGRPLVRGYQNDYIIDYNLGEISFTPGTIITRYSRIRVEYEYADQQYRRGILSGSHQQQLGKLELFTSFYQEKDNRHQTLFFDLTEEDMLRLSAAGDIQANLWSPAVDSLGYSADLLLYLQKDTLDSSGLPVRIYAYSTDESRAFYRLGFTQVGQGQGNYVLQEITPKGRVYQWVSPVNGVPQGAFEPVRLLQPPRKKQVVAAGASYAMGRWGKLYTEAALSEFDQNLFSELDEGDDKGLALKSGYALEGLPVFFDPAWHWKAGMEYELTNQNFTPIDRFRAVEYDRYWGLLPQQGFGVQPQAYPADDHLISLWAGLEKNAGNRLHYRLRNRQLQGLVNGWQHEVEAAKTLGIWAGSAAYFGMKNEQDQQHIRWERLQLEQWLNLPYVVPGWAYQQEHNTYYQPQTDSVTNSAQYFSEHRFYLRNPAESAGRYLLEYSLRQDKAPFRGEMAQANDARMLRAQWYTDPEKANQLGIQMSYRHSEVLLENQQDDNEERILTGQLQWRNQAWQGAIRQQLLYSAGSGRELRRDYVYVKVPTGQGTHIWRDNNGDGEQQLEEFFEAVLPDEKQYIRILLPSSELTQAYTTELQYRLNANSPQAWRDRGGLWKPLSELSAVLSIRLNQKLTEASTWQRFFPAATELADASLLHQRQQWQAALFYNRSNPVWGLEGGLSQQTRKQLLSGGFETGNTAHYHLAGRRSFTRSWNLRLQLSQGEQKDVSDFLGEQRFRVQYWGAEPQITWRPLQQLEFDLSGRYRHKENRLWKQSGEEALVKELGLGFLVSRQLTTSLRGQVKLVEIDFVGSANTPVGYALLEALRPGSNWTWNLQLQQRIMRGLQLNMLYDGRQSEGAPMVHTGRMMLRALF